jgi:hypothetical protein
MSSASDPAGTSPYREDGGGLPCPLCRASMLVAPGRRMTCAVHRCGEWWSRDALASEIDWRVVETAEPFRLFGVPPPELPCPECERGMILSMRAKVEFAHCDAHGLWLPRRERAVFDELGGWSRVLVARRPAAL